MPWKEGSKKSKENAIKHNGKLKENKDLIKFWIMQANRTYNKTKNDGQSIMSANSLIKKILKTDKTKRKFLNAYNKKIKKSKKEEAFDYAKGILKKEIERLGDLKEEINENKILNYLEVLRIETDIL